MFLSSNQVKDFYEELSITSISPVFINRIASTFVDNMHSLEKMSNKIN